MPAPAALPWHLRWLEAPTLWKSSRGGDVRVAVLDSAVAPLPAFAGRLEPYRPDGTPDDAPPLPADHGTFCASLIASGDAVVKGVAPLARLLSFPVSDGATVSYADAEEALAVGVIAAGAQVVCCSFVLEQCPDGIRQAVQLLRQNGVVVIGSAGNQADTASAFPEQVQGVAAVTAHLQDGSLREGARLGDWVDTAAPGEALRVLSRDGTRGTWSGLTSGAAAITAGVCALMLGLAESHAELEQLGLVMDGLIRATGAELEPPQPFKRLDALALLDAVRTLKKGLP